jgi:enamine deaminase RidA (YjgF/YER057c/UK114 family)
MPKREVSTTAIRKPVGVFSQATVVEAKGKLVFISGMTARRPDGSIAGIGDITEQTRQVCENIKAAVEAAGGTLDDVCRVDVYVRNMEHFEAIHKVRSLQAAAACIHDGRSHQDGVSGVPDRDQRHSGRCGLVVRFRSSPLLALRSGANFGI